jgi:hypothetical protein
VDDAAALRVEGAGDDGKVGGGGERQHGASYKRTANGDEEAVFIPKG